YNNLVKAYASTEFEGPAKVKAGSSAKYNLNVNSETVSSQWSVSDENIASIDENGVLTAKALGSVTITAYVSEYGLTVSKNIEVAKYNEIPLTKSMLSGSEAWKNGDINTYEKTVDNDLSTYFDGVEKGYVTIDLGKKYNIEAVGYAPRSGFSYRMRDGYFQGSSDGKTWTTLHRISEIPAENMITTADITSGEYRYIRYTIPTGIHTYNPNDSKPQEYCCNIAEIKLYGDSTDDINDGLALHISFDEEGAGTGSFNAEMGGKVKEKGEVAYESGINGNAVSIKYGAENYLELPDGLLDGASSAAVSFWFKQGDNGKDGWPFMTTVITDTQVYKSEKYLGILMSKSKDKLTAERYFSNSQERPEQAASGGSFGEWNYITVQYEPDYTSIYINGERTERIQSSASLKKLFTADAKFWIGHANWGSGEGLDGMVDDFRIYSRNLSENEIQALYNLK
ncbi:MAG: LamG-like jellyroll fold domain-containing protein, partial [Hominilimicola sp.]